MPDRLLRDVLAALDASPHGATCFVIAGEVGEGKTRKAASLVQPLRAHRIAVGGIVAPRLMIGERTAQLIPNNCSLFINIGTTTEIADYLRLLFARVGEPRCPDHGVTLEAQTVSQMVDHVLSLPEGSRLIRHADLLISGWRQPRSRGAGADPAK